MSLIPIERRYVEPVELPAGYYSPITYLRELYEHPDGTIYADIRDNHARATLQPSPEDDAFAWLERTGTGYVLHLRRDAIRVSPLPDYCDDFLRLENVTFGDLLLFPEGPEDEPRSNIEDLLAIDLTARDLYLYFKPVFASGTVKRITIEDDKIDILTERSEERVFVGQYMRAFPCPSMTRAVELAERLVRSPYMRLFDRPIMVFATGEVDA